MRDGSASGFATTRCPSPRSWPTVTTTQPQGDRRWRGPGRRWSPSSTKRHGDRSLDLQGCGWAVSLSPGRRGVTAVCGTPQGKLSQPLACPYWMERRERQWTPPPSPLLTAQAPEAKRKDEEEERTKKLEDLGQDVMLMAEAHELLLLGKPAWTAEQRARFRVLSTQITSKEASASSTPGRRKRKKRRKKKLPRISSFAHAARNLKSGVFSTGSLYLTVLCPVYWSYCGYMFIRQFTRAWNFTGFLHEGDQDPWTILA